MKEKANLLRKIHLKVWLFHSNLLKRVFIGLLTVFNKNNLKKMKEK